MEKEELIIEAYKVSNDKYNLFTRLFWNRSKFFLTVQALLVGLLFTVIYKSGENQVVLAIKIVGLASSILWLVINHHGRRVMMTWSKIIVEQEDKIYNGKDVKPPFKEYLKYNGGYKTSNLIFRTSIIVIVGWLIGLFI